MTNRRLHSRVAATTCPTMGAAQGPATRRPAMIRLLIWLKARACARRRHTARVVRMEDLNDRRLADLGLARDRTTTGSSMHTSHFPWPRIR